MGNQPVYRYPPRSHAYNCPCPRCVQCRSRPLSSGAWIWVAIPVAAGIFWILSAPLRIWHVIGRDGQEHPDTATYVAYGVSGGIVLLAMMFFSIRAARKQQSPPPKGRLRVEALTPEQLRPPPASVCVPRCQHLNAFKVDSGYWRKVGRTVIVCCWCPDCEEDLPASFRFPCCGCEPGDGIRPAVHVYNCPHRKEPS